MKPRLFFVKITCSIFLLLVNFSVTAQIKLTDSIPIDSKVKVGKLSNGLTYYIRQNKKPENRVELRLVVKAGSILEDDNQQGLAHMAEHMAFNGTKNFKKNDIISYLQSIGVEFGNDLNAYTGFDETVYMLPVPTDKPGNLEKGFQILEDWAHNVTFHDSDINDERNVILEESRLGKGAGDRMFRKIYPKMFPNSKYGLRLPIGEDSIIKNYDPQLIRNYYRDWYRPDLMAVFVVGDIDPATAETMIKAHFGNIKAPSSPRERIYSPVSPFKENEAIIVTDKEATQYALELHFSAQPYALPQTVGEYEVALIRSIFTGILNTRLRDITQQVNPPFLYGFTYFESYAHGYDQFNARLGLASEGAAKRGLTVLMEEIEKAKRFGFTQAELDRVKKNMESNMDQSYNERDKTESGQLIDGYINHFLKNAPIPGISKLRDYYKELLPQISLAEINQFSKSLEKTPQFLISLTGPPYVDSTNLTEQDLINTASAVAARTDLKPDEEKIIASELLKTQPKGGKILKESTDAKLGTKTWVLNNGTTVTIKKTDFKDDEIQLRARRFGGYSNYGVADKYNTQFGLQVVNAMGFGDFSPTDLQKALSGKSVGAGSIFSETTEGFSANSTVKDLETMFQLLYLKATAPRSDTALYQSYIQKIKAQMTFLMASPQNVFVDTLLKTVYHNDPMTPVAVPRPENFDQLNRSRILQIYKERFGNANGMEFSIVGNFDEALLKPLVEKYIGGLPATKTKFMYKDIGLRPVKGKKDLILNKGEAEKSLILAMYTGETAYSQDLALNMQAVSEVLNIRILEEMREKIQGIYGGGTSLDFDKYPYGHFGFFVQLPTGPSKVDTLLKALDQEIKMIVNQGPSKENLDKVKQQWIEQNKIAMKRNGTWLGFILDQRIDHKDVDRFLNSEKYIQALTPQSVQAAAHQLFDPGNVVIGVLQPDKK